MFVLAYLVGQTYGSCRHAAEQVLFRNYQAMLVEGRACIAGTLAILADEAQQPAVFFCAAGKDRTGVLAALVLSLLSVSDEDVASDYHRTGPHMDALIAWLRTHHPGQADAMVAHPPEMLSTPPEAIYLLLADIRARFGSVEGYVRSVGVTEETVANVRSELLTPSGATAG